MGPIVTLLIISTPAYAARLLADEALEARRLECRRLEANRRMAELKLRELATEITRVGRILRR